MFRIGIFFKKEKEAKIFFETPFQCARVSIVMDWLTDGLVTRCYKDLTHFQLPTQVSTLGENESDFSSLDIVCYKLKKNETRKVYPLI